MPAFPIKQKTCRIFPAGLLVGCIHFVSSVMQELENGLQKRDIFFYL